jgi:RsiW-degrading membrane proteinase PrsW (M82 family)
MNSVIALVIATAIPLVFLYIVYTQDLYRTGAFYYVIFCFIWGGIAYELAAQINPASVNFKLISFDNMLRFSAPIVEEILKGTILLYLIRRANFNYFVDGAIYGFAIGIGFAIFENYEYVLSRPDAALMLAIGRVLSTNLVHATGSATIGIGLGIARFDRSSRRLLILFSSLAMAIGLHMAFNNLVTRVNSNLQLLYAAGIGFAGAAFIVTIIHRGLREEKSWIEEKLGATDRVTIGETAIVNRLRDVQDILSPVAQRFGPQKADEIEKFLTIQAQLGIKRKILEKVQAQDGNSSETLEAEIEQLRTRMDEARRSVGAYCMLYLRNIFPEDTSPLWGRLQTIVQERVASGTPSDGPSLWSSLNDRIKQPNPPTNET